MYDSDPMDCSLPGSSVHGILQARILEWVAFSSPWDLPSAGIKPGSPALQEDSFPPEHLGLAPVSGKVLMEIRNITAVTPILCGIQDEINKELFSKVIIGMIS